MIKLGVLPVKSLLLVEGALWAASGGQVFMASLETHAIEVSAVKHMMLPRAVDRVCPSSTGILQCEWRTGWCILGLCVKGNDYGLCLERYN